MNRHDSSEFNRALSILAREGMTISADEFGVKPVPVRLPALSEVPSDTRRIVAYVVDFGLVWLAAGFLQQAAFPFAHPDSWYFVVIALAILNWIVLASLGATFGKWLLGLRVVGLDGQPPGIRVAARRSLLPGTVWLVLIAGATQLTGYFEPFIWFAVLLSIPVIIAELDEMGLDVYGRSHHDRYAGTFVVRHPRWFDSFSGSTTARTDRESRATFDPASIALYFGKRFEDRCWATLRLPPIGKRPHLHPADDLALRRALGFALDLVAFVMCWRLLDRLLAGRVDAEWLFCAMLAAFVVYWIGFVAFSSTPGALVAGVRIVDQRGNAPGFSRAIWRAMVPIPVILLVLFRAPQLDYYLEASDTAQIALDFTRVLVLFGATVDVIALLRTGCPLHDRLAGTFVIRQQS